MKKKEKGKKQAIVDGKIALALYRLDRQHRDMVEALLKSGKTVLKTMTPEDVDLIHSVFGISGEAGELLDAIKKAVFYRKPLDINNVIEELGDIEFYMEGLRKTLGITRDETLEANQKKLLVRYPQYKYTDKSARKRADKK